MTESRASIEAEASKKTVMDGKTLLRDAQSLLFRPGVQLRMSMAILVCIFSAVFPLFLFGNFGGIAFTIAFEVFLTVPILYGLLVMTRKVVNGEELRMIDLFAGFSRSYLKTLSTAFWFFLLAGIPIALWVMCSNGVAALYGIALITPAAEPYAIFVLILGIVVLILLAFVVLMLGMPAYLFLSIRVKDTKMPWHRAARMSFGLLKKEIAPYLVFRMRFFLLDIISVLTVCVLFPIYTIPILLISNALITDRLEETERGNH